MNTVETLPIRFHHWEEYALVASAWLGSASGSYRHKLDRVFQIPTATLEPHPVPWEMRQEPETLKAMASLALKLAQAETQFLLKIYKDAQKELKGFYQAISESQKDPNDPTIKRERAQTEYSIQRVIIAGQDKFGSVPEDEERRIRIFTNKLFLTNYSLLKKALTNEKTMLVLSEDLDDICRACDTSGTDETPEREAGIHCTDVLETIPHDNWDLEIAQVIREVLSHPLYANDTQVQIEKENTIIKKISLPLPYIFDHLFIEKIDDGVKSLIRGMLG